MTTTYSDGGSHTVNSSAADILVTSASTLDVVTGAAIVGPVAGASYLLPGANGITASGAGTAVSISGGSVTGGNHVSECIVPGEGVWLTDGASLSVSGGTIAPGSGQAGRAVYSTSAGALVVTAGTFAGPNGIWYAPEASGGSVTISGGTFTFSGDSIAASWGLLVAFSTLTGTAVISGGSFDAFPRGSLLFSAVNAGASFTVSGGSYASEIALYLLSGATVTFTGTGLVCTSHTIDGVHSATLTGTLSDSTSIDVMIVYYNNVVPSISASSTSVVFTGQ